MTVASKKSKRGRRPKPGGAASPAQRMRAYRARRKAAGIVVRRFTPEERAQWEAFKANAAARKRLKHLLAQVKQLEKEYASVRAQNARLEVQATQRA